MNQTGQGVFRRHGSVNKRQSSGAIVDRLEQRAYFSATFNSPVFYNGVAGGVGIAAADFNGDSKPDLVVSGVNPNISSIPVLAVYLNTNGKFGKPTLLPFDGTPSGVAVGDFTNNGKNDIAVINSTSNTVVLFMGDGAGNFTPGVGAGLAGQDGATSLAVADFNNDHFADIAVVEPTINQVEVQFGKGNGSFAAEASIPVPSPKKVIAADINGDGLPDVIVTSGNGSIYVSINEGNAKFSKPVSYSVGSGLTSINDFAVADLNGDSQPDLIAVGDAGAGLTTGTLAVLLNQGGGTGTFGTAADTPTTIDPVGVVTGTFANTGHVDLGVTGAAGALTIYPGVGDGTFGAAEPIFSTQLVPPFGQAIAADFNADGLSDIAIVSQSQSGMGVIINTTTGTTVTPPPNNNPPPPTTPTPSPLVPTVAGKLPATLVGGGKIATIRELVTLTNSSSSAISGSITLNLLLANTAAGETGDPVVATITKSATILAKKGKTFPMLVKTLPAGVSGPRYLVAEVIDPSMEINVGASASTISIVAPVIDLSGAFIKRPTMAKAGHNAGITFSVTNNGTSTLNGMLPIQVQTSATPGIDSSSVVIDSFKKKVVIKPGKTISIHVNKVISATAGSYYLIVQLDPSNTLGDVNTMNNTFVTGSAVTLV